MHKLGSTKTLGWKDEQRIDHEGPRNVKSLYLKGSGKAKHLKQGCDMFSFGFSVENKHGLRAGRFGKFLQ